jgi:hypothetical protein
VPGLYPRVGLIGKPRGQNVLCASNFAYHYSILDFHGATRRNEFPGAARCAILDFGLSGSKSSGLYPGPQSKIQNPKF